MEFEELTRTGGAFGTLTWEAPDGWQQGRGMFGGLTLAVLARAAATAVDVSERPLRAISAEIAGAVLVGPTTVQVERLRHGSGLSLVSARMKQGGEVVVDASVTFGKPRTVDLDGVPMAPPEVGSWKDTPALPAGASVPTFAQHLEYRPLHGLPFSGAKEAACDGWIRFKEPGAIHPRIALVALADAWWPAALPTLSAFRPFGTVSFTADIFEGTWSLDEPLYHRARMLAAQHGFIVELRELWSPGGELLALNHQTIAVIK